MGIEKPGGNRNMAIATRGTITGRGSGGGVRVSAMMDDQNYVAHSGRVEMELILDGQSISIAQMGPDFLLVDSPRDYPPGHAVILLRVDDSERRWKVRLPDGVSKHARRVALQSSE